MNRALISFLAGALLDLCAILVIVVFRVMVPVFPVLKAGSAQAVVLAAIPLIGLLSGLIAAALKRLRLFNVEVTKAVSLGVSWLAGCVLVDVIAFVAGSIAIAAYLRHTE